MSRRLLVALALVIWTLGCGDHKETQADAMPADADADADAAADASVQGCDGILGFPTLPLVPSAGLRFRTGDVDADGNVNLVGWSPGSNGFGTYRGRGTGLFEKNPLVTTSSSIRLFAVGDLNGDGRADAVGRNDSTLTTLLVFLSDGGGAFHSSSLSLTIQPFAAAIGDVDGDTLPDIVGVSASTAQLFVARNSASGFTAATYYALATTQDQAWSVALADMNADGSLDAVAVGGKNVYVLANDGTGAFGAGTPYDLGPTPAVGGTGATDNVVTVDLDGDGDRDVIVAANLAVSVLLNSGTGTLAAAVEYPVPPSSVEVIASADIDGDGNPDVLAGTSSPSGIGDVWLLKGTGGGGLASPIRVYREAYRTFEVADVNNDSKPDLLVLGARGVRVLRNINGELEGKPLVRDAKSMDGTAADLDNDGRSELIEAHMDELVVHTSAGDRTYAVPDGAVRLAVADLNHDGSLDVISISDTAITGLLNDGLGNLAAGPTTPHAGQPFLIATGDVDGDGYADLVEEFSVEAKVELRRGIGNGSFTTPTSLWGAAQGIAVGDFDEDGRDDVVIAYQNPSAPGVKLARLPGGTQPTLGSPVVFDVSGGIGPLRSVDLDADHHLDLLVGTGRFAIVWRGNGAGDLQEGALVDFGSGGTGNAAPAVGDLNGDNKLDVVLTDAPSRSLLVMRGNGDGTLNPGTLYDSTQSAAASIVDADNDGRADIWIVGNADRTLLAGRCYVGL